MTENNKDFGNLTKVPKNIKFKKLKERSNVFFDDLKNEITFKIDNDNDVDIILESIQEMEKDFDHDSLILHDYLKIAIDRIKRKRLKGHK